MQQRERQTNYRVGYQYVDKEVENGSCFGYTLVLDTQLFWIHTQLAF